MEAGLEYEVYGSFIVCHVPPINLFINVPLINEEEVNSMVSFSLKVLSKIVYEFFSVSLSLDSQYIITSSPRKAGVKLSNFFVLMGSVFATWIDWALTPTAAESKTENSNDFFICVYGCLRTLLAGGQFKKRNA